MKHCARAVFAVTLIASLIAGSIHASRVPGTPQLPTERKVYEIYNDRYGTAYESSAQLDAMRVHDMDFFDLPENHYVYVQGIAHCANDSGGFGWYRPILPDGGLTHALFFTVTIPQVDDLTLNGDYTATFTPATEWGFYMRRPDGTGEWLAHAPCAPRTPALYSLCGTIADRRHIKHGCNAMTNNESKKVKITTEISSLSLNFPSVECDGYPFGLSSRPTVRRLDMLTCGHSSVLPRDVGEQVATNVYDEWNQEDRIFGALIDIPVWKCLDPVWDGERRLDCYTGKLVGSMGLLTIGIPLSHVKWLNGLDGCCAYPSTDVVQGATYKSDCTAMEAPREWHYDDNCKYCDCGMCTKPDPDDPPEVQDRINYGNPHPKHGVQGTEYPGELYVNGRWRLAFEGDSEVENFIKILDDENPDPAKRGWYYISVLPVCGPVLGSGMRSTPEDKEACYKFMTQYVQPNQYWYGKRNGIKYRVYHAQQLP